MPNLAAISLLAPGLLAGVMLLGLPIAAHLLHRKARRRIIFPSVALLSAASASQSSIFKLRRLFLLLLRCLAVLALVLAFTQPTWRSAEAQRTGHTGAGVVILIDRSASSGQLVAGVPAMTHLKSVALNAIDTLSPGEDHANIVFADASPRTAFVAMTTNTDALRSAISKTEPTYQRADITGSLALAYQELLKHDGPKRLLIVSDLQASNWADAIQRINHNNALPPNTAVTIIPPNGNAPGNLTLQNPTTRPASPRTDRPVSLTVQAVNHAQTIQPATVRIEIDGRPSGSQTVTIEPGQTHDIVFEHTFTQPGDHRVTFTLSPDALEADNTCYHVVHAVQQTPATVIADDGFDRPGSSAFFLTRALAPHGDNRDRYRVVTLQTGNIWPDLSESSAVFFGNTGALNTEHTQQLYRFINQGGTAIIFCGDSPVNDNLNAIDALNPQNTLPWMPLSPRSFDKSEQSLTISDGDWRSSLLTRFGESAQIAFSQVKIHRAWAGGPVGPFARTLLAYNDGTPALLQTDIGQGRLLIANFGISEQQSDFGKHGLFVALTQTIVEDALDTHLSSQTHTVAGPATLISNTPIQLNGQAPTVFGPTSQRTTEADFTPEPNRTTIVIPSPDTPGFYTAQQGETVLGTLAVNPDPREGNLARIAEDELLAAFNPHTQNASIQPAGVPTIVSTRGKALWGYLLLSAFVLLGLESLLLGYWRR